MPTDRPELNVLIVEDHADSAAVLKALLERDGHRAHIAHTLAEARHACAAAAAAATDRFDVILCDINLPDGTGATLAREVRLTPAAATTRLIAVTAHCMPEELRQLYASEFDGFVAKPLRLADLIAQMYPPRAAPEPAPSPEPAFASESASASASASESAAAAAASSPSPLAPLPPGGEARRAALRDRVKKLSTRQLIELSLELRRCGADLGEELRVIQDLVTARLQDMTGFPVPQHGPQHDSPSP